MRLFFKRLLVASGYDLSWFSWAAFLAFMIAGAALRVLLPDAVAIPLLGAMGAAFLIGIVAYRFEFSRQIRT